VKYQKEMLRIDKDSKMLFDQNKPKLPKQAQLNNANTENQKTKLINNDTATINNAQKINTN